jgi:hypothetical protein
MWLNRPEVAAIIGSEARQLSGGAVGSTGSANDSADLPRVAVIGPAQGRSHAADRQMAAKGPCSFGRSTPGAQSVMSSMTSGAEVGVLMVRRPR